MLAWLFGHAQQSPESIVERLERWHLEWERERLEFGIEIDEVDFGTHNEVIRIERKPYGWEYTHSTGVKYTFKTPEAMRAWKCMCREYDLLSNLILHAEPDDWFVLEEIIEWGGFDLSDPKYMSAASHMLRMRGDTVIIQMLLRNGAVYDYHAICMQCLSETPRTEVLRVLHDHDPEMFRAALIKGEPPPGLRAVRNYHSYEGHPEVLAWLTP